MIRWLVAFCVFQLFFAPAFGATNQSAQPCSAECVAASSALFDTLEISAPSTASHAPSVISRELPCHGAVIDADADELSDDLADLSALFEAPRHHRVSRASFRVALRSEPADVRTTSLDSLERPPRPLPRQ